MNMNDFLVRLRGVKGGGSQYSARCPAHDDQHASLSIKQGGDGKIMLHCHAGCTPEAVVAALGLTMNDLFPDPVAKPNHAPNSALRVNTMTAIAVYDYLDASGKLLAQKRRYPDKRFYWFRPDGKGGWYSGRGDAPKVLYNLPDVAASDVVWIVEGEKDADTLKARGKVTTCNPDGAGPRKWLPEFAEALRGKTCHIIPDNDDQGHEHAANIAHSLRGVAKSVKLLNLAQVWREIPEKGDVTDFFNHSIEISGETGAKSALDALESLADGAPEYAPQTEASSSIAFFDSVEYEEPKYLVNPYIPLEKVTIIQADSGVGKTALACKLAACVSRGMPVQEAPCGKGKVLLLSVEDDPATLRGRIEASGGDVSQCAFMENAYELTFKSDCIEQIIKQYGIVLVVFDPLQAFLGGDVDMHRANETRPIMGYLAAMARRTGCAIVIVSHMSKGTSGGKAIYRTLGSVDIVAASRSVMYVERNPRDEGQCVAVHIKSSNAEKGRAFLYRIGERGGVTWEGYSTLTVDDLQQHGERQEEGIQFDNDPVVHVISALYEENPKGVYVSWDQLTNYADRLLGYCPCYDSNEWRKKLMNMRHGLIEKRQLNLELCRARSKEHVEFGERVPGRKDYSRGVRITPYTLRREYQTRISQGISADAEIDK